MPHRLRCVTQYPVFSSVGGGVRTVTTRPQAHAFAGMSYKSRRCGEARTASIATDTVRCAYHILRGLVEPLADSYPARPTLPTAARTAAAPSRSQRGPPRSSEVPRAPFFKPLPGRPRPLRSCPESPAKSLLFCTSTVLTRPWPSSRRRGSGSCFRTGLRQPALPTPGVVAYSHRV